MEVISMKQKLYGPINKGGSEMDKKELQTRLNEMVKHLVTEFVPETAPGGKLEKLLDFHVYRGGINYDPTYTLRFSCGNIGRSEVLLHLPEVLWDGTLYAYLRSVISNILFKSLIPLLTEEKARNKLVIETLEAAKCRMEGKVPISQQAGIEKEKVVNMAVFSRWLRKCHDEGRDNEYIHDLAKRIIRGQATLEEDEKPLFLELVPGETCSTRNIEDYVYYAMATGNINGVVGENLLKLLNHELSVEIERSYVVSVPGQIPIHTNRSEWCE